MKMTKKIVALVSAFAIAASFAVTASAELALSKATATASVDTVAAGESVTIYGGWDTLLGATGAQVSVYFDDTAFEVNEANNEAYNFAKKPKKSYLPMFIDEAYVAARWEYDMGEGEILDGFNVTGFFPITAAYNSTTKAVVYMFADTTGEMVVDPDYIEYDVTPNIGTIFTAKEDIKPGTYTFNIEVVCSEGNTGRVAKTASVDVTVEGGEEEVSLVAGVESITTPGKHNGKASFSASAGIATTGLTKITVKNSTDADRVEEWEAPATYGEGITKVLPIVTYNKVTELIGSTFTVEFWNATEVFKTLTYKVQ